MKLIDEDMMKAGNPLAERLKQSTLTSYQQEAANNSARVLEGYRRKNRETRDWVAAIQDKKRDGRGVGAKLFECGECKGRWENPHRDYTAAEMQKFIDKDKI